MTIDGKDIGSKWPIFDKKDMKYVLINSSHPSISENPFIDEYTFWNSLPLLSNVQMCTSSLNNISIISK